MVKANFSMLMVDIIWVNGEKVEWKDQERSTIQAVVLRITETGEMINLMELGQFTTNAQHRSRVISTS